MVTFTFMGFTWKSRGVLAPRNRRGEPSPLELTNERKQFQLFQNEFDFVGRLGIGTTGENLKSCCKYAPLFQKVLFVKFSFIGLASRRLYYRGAIMQHQIDFNLIRTSRFDNNLQLYFGKSSNQPKILYYLEVFNFIQINQSTRRITQIRRNNVHQHHTQQIFSMFNKFINILNAKFNYKKYAQLVRLSSYSQPYVLGMEEKSYTYVIVIVKRCIGKHTPTGWVQL